MQHGSHKRGLANSAVLGVRRRLILRSRIWHRADYVRFDMMMYVGPFDDQPIVVSASIGPNIISALDHSRSFAARQLRAPEARARSKVSKLGGLEA